MPQRLMVHETDPVLELMGKIGDLKGIDVFHNQVLAAVYQRPAKTASGIYLPDQHLGEDAFQSKVALIVKTGADAFNDPTGKWFRDVDLKVGDWIFFRASDGWNITVNNVLCRMLDDTVIRGKVTHPDQVW